ncbi:hypothetical protein KPH14_006431 [Odynerus spinipes]|uniref:Uncharacterized protein n=1 Tax=Odynerus spinipes TaxID=1348599 RepID=A0AAD9VS13_9HYME|nr:hypothetical protein KPH14_006431 [Odynerus spinipes]
MISELSTGRQDKLWHEANAGDRNARDAEEDEKMEGKKEIGYLQGNMRDPFENSELTVSKRKGQKEENGGCGTRWVSCRQGGEIDNQGQTGGEPGMLTNQSCRSYRLCNIDAPARRDSDIREGLGYAAGGPASGKRGLEVERALHRWRRSRLALTFELDPAILDTMLVWE